MNHDVESHRFTRDVEFQRVAGLYYTADSALRRAAYEAFGEREGTQVGEPDWQQLPAWELPGPPERLPNYPNQEGLAPVVQIQRRMLMDKPIPHGHFLAFGLSDLYNYTNAAYEAARADENLVSGMGIELSLRLQPSPDTELAPWFPEWVLKLFQQEMSYVLTSQRVLLDGHWVRFRPGPSTSTLAGLACVWDPSFDSVQSGSGIINVVQLVLLTPDEVDLCEHHQTSKHLVEAMRETNPDLVSTPGRPSILMSSSVRERIRQLAQQAAAQ